MKKSKTQVSDSKRGFLKGLGAVAAATPIIGSMLDLMMLMPQKQIMRCTLEVHISNLARAIPYVLVFFF